METLTCTCGRVLSGETAEGLLVQVEAHIAAEHAPREGEGDVTPAATGAPPRSRGES